MRQDINFLSNNDKSAYALVIVLVLSLVILIVTLLVFVFVQYIEMKQSKLYWQSLSHGFVDVVDKNIDLSVIDGQVNLKTKTNELMAALIAKKLLGIEISEIRVSQVGNVTILGVANDMEVLSTFLMALESNQAFEMLSEYTLSIAKQGATSNLYWEARWQ